MSSHRAARTDRRDSGHRRIAIATTASAVGGTALAVLFGTVFAHGTAPATATLVNAAKAELAPAAVTTDAVKKDAHDTTVDDVNAGAAPTTAPTTAPAKPAPVKTHRTSTPTTTLRPPPAPPTKAPAATTAPEPTHASTGAS